MENILTTNLIKTAISMRSKAYAPYSNYKVGAAIQTNNNIIFGGCNIENSSYSLTCCAERVAIFKAISEGYKKFKALSVSTNNGGMPCGACRQVIWDLCGNIPIYICDNKNLIKTLKTIELIPHPFDKNKLK
jgi:cytidine deaminase